MIRTLYKKDVPQLLVIEESVHIVPWTKETFLICFETGYLGWVLEEDNQILAFIIISLHREECHILNLGVARLAQRSGYAYLLMNHALSVGRQSGASIAYLEVRRSNLPAINLYRKLNFHLVGERKNYYPIATGYEDALIFAKSLQIESVL